MYQSAIGRQYKQRLGKTRGDAEAIVTLGRSSLRLVAEAVPWAQLRIWGWGDRVKPKPKGTKQGVQEFLSVAPSQTARQFHDEFMNFW